VEYWLSAMLSIRSILPLMLLVPLAAPLPAADNPLGTAMAGGDQLWERGDLIVVLHDAGEQAGVPHYIWRLRDQVGRVRPELELAFQSEWSGDARGLASQVTGLVIPRQPTLVVIAAGQAAALVGVEEKKAEAKPEEKKEAKPDEKDEKKAEKKVDTGLDPAGFAAQLKESIDKLKEAGIEVVVLGPSVVSDAIEAKAPADEKAEAFARLAGEVARAAEVPFVDLRAPCLDYLKTHPAEGGKPVLYAGERRYTAAWMELAGTLLAKAIGERMAALPMRIDVQDQPFIEKAQVEIDLRRVRKGAKVDIYYTLDGKEPSAKTGRKYDKPFAITGGNTTLRVLAVDSAHSATASAKAVFTRVKARVGENLPRRELGLEWALYQGSWPTLPEFSGLKPAATGVWHAPELAAFRENAAYAAHTEKLGLRFAGYIDIPVEGVYRFETTSDDGSRMWIDDELVVDNDGGHGMRFRGGRVALREGLHQVRVDWFQGTGGMGLEVWWSSEAGIRRARVPDNAWLHNPAKPYDWNPPPPKKDAKK
jgi:hypothetical protein